MDLHGGNIYQSNIELDFSVNVNPLGPPEGIRDLFLNSGDWLSHYPRRDQKENEDRLLALIGLSETGTIPGRSTASPGTEIGAVIGNGASELLMAHFLALRPKRVLLTEPSFYGYRHAARAVGAELLSYPLREDLDFALDEGLIKQIDPSIDLILLASPNNPNGGRIRDDLLREILRKAASHRIPLLLDACFMPLSLLGEEGQAPGEGDQTGGEALREGLSAIDSYATWLKSLFDLHGGLEVLGAFTKTFAIPSLRLGYLLGREEGLKEIRKLLPEWNLSLPAQKALEEIARMGETGRLRPYLKETGHIIRQESQYLREKLQELGFRVYGGDGNFILFADCPAKRGGVDKRPREEIRGMNTRNLYEELLRENILIRDCGNYRGLGQGFYRVAVLSHEKNRKLIRLLGKIIRDSG